MYSVTGQKENRSCRIWEVQKNTKELFREMDDYLYIQKRMRDNQACLREVYFSVKYSSQTCNRILLIGIKNDKGQC